MRSVSLGICGIRLERKRIGIDCRALDGNAMPYSGTRCEARADIPPPPDPPPPSTILRVHNDILLVVAEHQPVEPHSIGERNGSVAFKQLIKNKEWKEESCKKLELIYIHV